MADEQLPTEETVVETTPEQTPESEVQTTESVETPSTPEVTPEPDRGDPRIAMQEERRKRQELEQRSNDPNWIYEQARRLGLAADETPSTPPVQTTPNQPAPQAPDVASIVEHQLDYREAIKEWPELATNDGLRMWAAALVNQGHKPTVAADIMRKEIAKQAGKSVKSEVAATLEDKAASEAMKLNADAITSTAQASSQTDDEELNARIRNWKNPEDQEAAILEKQRRIERAKQR